MPDLIFSPLDAEEHSRYQDWFHDPELSRRINYPDTVWFDYITTSPDVYTWMIYADVGPLGVIQFEKDHGRACFSIAVNPRLRGQGYGKRMMRAFLNQPEVREVACVHAGVEYDNQPSMHCLRAVGFTMLSPVPDEHGFIEFIYTVHKTPNDACQTDAHTA